jgi:peptidoglycan/xylan/chitin deacetylase (PgdA/CDA1 family)
MDSTPKILVTTSWDDGHPLDMRIAEVLARRGMRGTFYVPMRPVAGDVITRSQMRDLLDMGMEIGSHSMTHPILTELSVKDIDREMRDSRVMLEDILGIEIPSFCYPRGRFNRRVAGRAAKAGYRVCRTTVDFQTGLDFDPVRMPVSLQLFPQDQSTHYRHTLRHRNWRGLWNWHSRWGAESDLEKLLARMVGALRKNGGVFHIWGHSWEVDQSGLWQVLERAADLLGPMPESVHLTNSQVLDAALARRTP